jgi:hypothetical protein
MTETSSRPAGGFTNSGPIAPDGFVWAQEGGNYFVARNLIMGYAREGVQVNAGPNAVVGNTYSNMISSPEACALAVYLAWPGVLTNGDANYQADFSTCFVGNSVYGGRHGLVNDESGNAAPTNGYSFNCSGNAFTLYPPYDGTFDGVANAVDEQYCLSASVCGNTLYAGGRGFTFFNTNGTALILNNNFSGATFGGIGGGAGNSLTSAQIYGNILSEGVTFHVELDYSNSFAWFLDHNTYLSPSSTSIPPFFDPISSAAHVSN